MAIASTRTLLPLDTFARILGINPLHFNGVHLDSSDVPNVCESPLVQYAYQDSDRVGREEIAQAIQDAESQITDLLGFSPLADYFSSYHHYSGYYPGYNTPVLRLPRGYFIEAGSRVKISLHAAAPVVYTDVDPDNPDELETGTYYETATIIANVPAGTNSDEIAVFYSGQNGDDAYEIRPLTNVVIVNNNEAHITVPRAQLVNLDRFMGLNFFPVNGVDDADFLTDVDVYRVYTDPSGQVNYDYAVRCCDTLSLCQSSGRLFLRDARLSMVYTQPATWDATLGEFACASWCSCGFPAGAQISYRAGLVGREALVWQRAIAYYALSLLDRPLCSCESLKAMMAHWSNDLAMNESVDGNSRTQTLAPGLLNNPLGTTRAAIYVWRLIQRYQLGEAV
jgi:hypothetical protein